MAAKKRRKPGLIWRVLFGHNGPTRARLKTELEKALRVKLTDTFVVPTRDSTGRVQQQKWRINPDGTTQQVQQRPKKKAAAKKASGKRTASQSSKPSRASRTGSTQRQRQTVAVPQVPRRARAEPLAERVLRNPDGTLNGSRKRSAEAKVAQEYAKAAKDAATAERRAERLLGWDQA